MEIDIQLIWPGWKVLRQLGRGSFGAVYEIERDNYGHKEKAALKIITVPQRTSEIEDLLNDGYDKRSITARYAGLMRDIVREYSIMADMKGCANIVYCDDWKAIPHDNGVSWDIFIKMELLTPLTKALGATVSNEQAVKIGKDLCNALVLCEKRNLIHRDIKPQNIFVAPDGTYKLGDFGIAKTAERTTGGTRAGTYQYMAPEVYNNQPYGSKADIYSLGLVLYWLLNERRTPFLPLPPTMPTASDEEWARAGRFRGEPIPAPAHGSRELQWIVLKACAFDPKDRYQSAEEMLRDLNRVADLTDDSERTGGQAARTVHSYTGRADDKKGGGALDSADRATGQTPWHRYWWTLLLGFAAVAVIMLSVLLKQAHDPTPPDPTLPDSTFDLEASVIFEETPSSASTLEPTAAPTVMTTETITPTAVPTSTKKPSKDDILAIGENITYPKKNAYLSEYETMYVKSEKGHSIYVYFSPKAIESNRRSYFAYEGDQVTVLARENGLSCILFPDSYGKIHVGWVNSQHLVYVY